MSAVTINDGGPAFPWGEPGTHLGGATLRDYFAAKAMPAMLGHLAQGIRPQDCIVMAEDAYSVADAMIRARAGASVDSPSLLAAAELTLQRYDEQCVLNFAELRAAVALATGSAA